jgi:hypothetical protein
VDAPIRGGGGGRPYRPQARQDLGQAGSDGSARRWSDSIASAYLGFTVKHFHEHLVKDYGFGWGYTWLKLHLQWARVVPKAPRKGAHRRKRERRPLRGMMLHQDGSRHEWLEGEAPLDLIVTLDDATGAIYSAFLVEEEGTASTFRALKEVFSAHGLHIGAYSPQRLRRCRTGW